MAQTTRTSLKVTNLTAPDGTPFEVRRIEKVALHATELKSSLGIRDEHNDFLEKMLAFRRVTHIKGTFDGQPFHGIRMQFSVYVPPESNLPRNDALGGLSELLGVLAPKKHVAALAWDLIDPVTESSRGVSLLYNPRARSWRVHRKLLREHGISALLR